MKRTFVCASSCMKQYVEPSYGCRGTLVVARMDLYCVKKSFNTYSSGCIERQRQRMYYYRYYKHATGSEKVVRSGRL